ncbi:anti-phage defense-associated sirtuin Dsr1 [Aquibaculum sediminis]|uniref:anti-phage defense-associated sirtuin Dsr1 n=1 Tax=Aquibaculum sediminis TaxID=3231907 RepID=UPI00345383F2
MQFKTNGPDIPDGLLQAHEEGRLVFFCGAGISYPAGLPGYKGLVEEIYRLNGTTFFESELQAFESERYDATLDLLERRLPGQRLDVRRALTQVLKPKLRRKGATDTHAALLRLGRNRAGALRLVTTNFDRLFHVAAKRTRQRFHGYAAPMLPIPKDSRWDGLVYLHGLMPRSGDQIALHRLVVTSGDFGLAYLTERWAARFVSELFRNYAVCFVGYSINDPVLRYMMDALAADRMLGEVTSQFWALGGCEPGEEAREINEWKAKGVTPILYSVAAGTNDHSALHKTLQAWADTYRDGVTGKERIVVAHALARPSASTQQDDFVGRMLWALSDWTGLPAKRFAEFNPVPSLEWLLDAFTFERYGHADLARFGVPSCDQVDEKLRFSLIHRPTPYPLAPPMQLIIAGNSHSQWDNVMFQLGRWLMRHLNDPRLVSWIADHGGQLHVRWAFLIEQRLAELAQLERNGMTAELADIRASAPNAVPEPLMRTLWRLLLSGRVKSLLHDVDLFSWKSRLQHEGLSATMRLELRELLSPKVRLRKPFRWEYEPENTAEPTRVRHRVDWELVLAADHVYSALRDLFDAQWQPELPALLEDIQQLLRDALDLLQELGEADERNDPSHWDLPSIRQHWQNRRLRDWVFLIELLRDAWLAMRRVDGIGASRVAAAWFKLPYPTFKRLGLFAASEGGITPKNWVDWLLKDDCSWLWATNLHRELMRLLALQGRRLPRKAQFRLEQAILQGPPREQYRDDLEPEEWRSIRDRSIWLRLAKLHASGLVLGKEAAERFEALSVAYPGLVFEPHEREEFLVWMTGTGDPDFIENQVVDIAPRRRHDLAQWLVERQPDRSPLYEDTWPDVCRTRFFHSLCALCDLARRGKWPTERWGVALQVWSEDGTVARSWRFGAPLVDGMPETVVQELAHAVTRWLEVASKSIDRHETILLHICERVLNLPLDDDVGIRDGDGRRIEQPVMEAINHPVGRVTEALINLWFKREPNDGEGLPADIGQFFTQLCDVRVRRFRHGRVLLASQLIALFRVDRVWTERNLLPRFNWTTDRDEAKAAWEGFLQSPRLYQPLLEAFKPHFLECANRYIDLGEHRHQFAAFLTYAALGPIEGYSVDDLRRAIAALPQEGLEEASQALYQAIEGAADQREEFWVNRVQPFWQEVWPKDRERVSPRLAESLARLAISARGEFPAALAAVREWLKPIEHPHFVLHMLLESGLCTRFPLDVVALLDAVISDQIWRPHELGACLGEVIQAAPNLKRDVVYIKLQEYSCQR